jgi:hypothetical protein
MKSKEEIEQLAEKDFADDAHGSPTATFLEKGYIKGYTQCQEDIVEKYTEQDMIDAIIYGSSLTTSNVRLYAHNYIKSLK